MNNIWLILPSIWDNFFTTILVWENLFDTNTEIEAVSKGKKVKI